MKAMQEAAHITHAVIGTQETINFGISTDPAFFQILSSTLYKNPILAVVRETLCNAWDAHIDAGKVNKAIEVTIADDYLTIRDFGKGIPHDQIGQIYGVYGASTKKTDSKQTGSFGLGCKSPFAYAEHFEVTSWNQGIKSVYALSRSSASTSGTPGITRLLNVPTDQTGLQVRIRIQASDEHKFKKYANNIVTLGGIKTTINGVPTQTINLETTPGSWTLIQDALLPSEISMHKLFIRYGTVIYPVEHNATYYDVMRRITHIVDDYTYGQSLIIQAAPETLAVMPNRESLSLQDETCESLKLLLTKFIKNWDRKFQASAHTIAMGHYDAAVVKGDVHALLNMDQIPYTRDRSFSSAPPEGNNDALIRKIAEICVHQNLRYGVFDGLRSKLLRHRLKCLADINKLDRGMLQSFNKLILSKQYRDRPTVMTHKWYQKRVLKQVGKALSAQGLSTKSLCISRRSGDSWPRRRGKVPSEITSLAHLDTLFQNTKLINPLFKLVFFSTSRKFAEENYKGFLSENGYKSSRNILFYILPAQKNLWPAAHAAFTSIGYQIIDLTIEHDWMPAPYVAPAPKEKVIKIPGRRTLASYYSPDKTLVKSIDEKDPKERIIQFQYYALLRRSREQHGRDYIRDMANVPFSLVEPIAKLGIGVETMNTEDSLRKQNIPCMAEFVIRSVTSHIQASLTIAEWRENSLLEYNRMNNSMSSSLVAFIEAYGPIQKHLGLVQNLTDDDRYALRWFDWLNRGSTHQTDSVKYLDGVRRTLVQDTRKYLDNIPFNQDLKNAVKALQKNELLELLDFNKLMRILVPKANTTVDPVIQAKTQAIIMAAL